MKKHFTLVRYLLLLAVLLLFYNCEEDYDKPGGTEIHTQSSQRIIIGNEAAEKEKELVKLLKNNGTNSLAKLLGNGGGSTAKDGKPIDVISLIDKTEIYEIKQGNGTINYTYRVNHPDATPFVFYNILLKSAPAGSNKIELIQYTMEPGFASDYYNGTVGFERFSGIISVQAITSGSGYPCDDTPTVPIPVTGGVGGGGAGAGGGGGNGTTPAPGPGGTSIDAYQQLVNARFLALQMMAGEPWLEVSRSPRYFRTASPPGMDNAADPCDDAQDIGVLGPIYTSDEDNCEELFTKSSDTDFADKMSELTSKAGDQNFESAYTMYQNAAQGLLFSGEATGTSNAPEVSLNLAQSPIQSTTNAIGFMHCHLDNGTTFKIFSFSDLIAMAQLATVSTRPTKELVIYLTTSSGTFALKVNNRITLKNNLLKMQVAVNSYERSFATKVKKHETLDQQALGFLNFLKDDFTASGLGLDLYQLNTGGNWDKLKLSSNGRRITKITCQ